MVRSEVLLLGALALVYGSVIGGAQASPVARCDAHSSTETELACLEGVMAMAEHLLGSSLGSECAVGTPPFRARCLRAAATVALAQRAPLPSPAASGPPRAALDTGVPPAWQPAFAAAAPPTRPDVRPAGAASRTAAGAAAPSATAALPRRAGRSANRLEIGTAYHLGAFAGTVYSARDWRLQADDAVGAGGFAGSLAYWRDGVFFPWMSLGLEYQYVSLGSSGDALMPQGVGVFTDPVRGSATLDIDAHVGFLNLAASRPINDSVVPFAGFGLGLGVGRAEVDMHFHNDFIGTFDEHAEGSRLIAGVQGFGGARLRIADGYYASVLGRASYLDGRPIGIEQSFLTLSFGGALGVSF